MKYIYIYCVFYLKLHAQPLDKNDCESWMWEVLWTDPRYLIMFSIFTNPVSFKGEVKWKNEIFKK